MSEQGTVTLLFTDLVGSSEQFSRLGDDAADALVDELQRAFRDVVDMHRGQVVKEVGDGLMAAFSSAIDGANCAVAMQQCARRVNEARAELDRMGLKVGLHAGEPIRRGGDYFGTPVHIAVRILQLADAGQIVASEVVRTLVGSRGGLTFRPLGTRELRGIQSPVPVYEVSREEPSAEETRRTTRAPDARHDTAVILFADVVDSTALSERLGDAAFHDRARTLEQRVRALVPRHAGSAVDGRTLGDGVLAVFTSAREAIAAAIECASAGKDLGLALHLGLHAGDVMREAGNVYGMAVAIASRISGASQPNEILVSVAVRDIARASAGVEFADRGEHALKGIEEPQRLYAVRVPSER